MNMLKRLASLLESFPIKSIFITVIVVTLLVSGVRNVFMATGNDTLVKSSTDVYQDNLMLEEEFGGESVIVLYESDHLLTPENLAHMKGLENALHTSDSIYSILSPVTLVEEMANKQGEKFQEGIEEVIKGLDTMGSKLIKIGTEMSENAQNNQRIGFPKQEGLEMPNLGGAELPEFEGTNPPKFDSPELPKLGEIQLPDIEGQLAELNKGYAQLIGAQENLGDGTQNLVNGYAQFGTKTGELGESLGALADQMGDNPQQAQQLREVSGGLNELSKQMVDISKNTAQLPGISTQTISGLENIQKKLSEQLNEQKQQQEQIQAEQKQMQEDMKQQFAKQEQMQKEMKKQQEVKQEKIKDEMLVQQREKENQMREFQEKMHGKMDEQASNLSTLAEGLMEMGESLQTISQNMETIHGYSDIMTPGLPTKQATLDNMVYDDDQLRPMFEEVIVDDKYMLMMIRFEGNTTDAEKSKVVGTINDYLDAEKIDSVKTIVSGKPVLDNAIRSSMQESMQVMLVLALIFMVIVLFLVFNVRWRLLSLATVLTAVIATVGAMGWLNIPITMVSMAVFPILIGLGIDYGIQFQNRYTEEMNREEVGND
ncbi:MMPL family transporter [Siminovitchia sediminis]|uniref:MMPL family transporter n=1 Tax=Siminovitchia sediminis TaxID=1274353 RepID=A0ABW4KIJ8_9BACI